MNVVLVASVVPAVVAAGEAAEWGVRCQVESISAGGRRVKCRTGIDACTCPMDVPDVAFGDVTG
jgi:hypothetical protein